MTMIRNLTAATVLCVAPAIAQADGWKYASEVCKEDKTNCLTNVAQAMSIDFYLGGVLTIEELQELNENIDLTDDMMIPPRTWIRVS